MNKEIINPISKPNNFKQVCHSQFCMFRIITVTVQTFFGHGRKGFQTQTTWWEDKPHPSTKQKKLKAQLNTD
jgi:hypothetical protein